MIGPATACVTPSRIEGNIQDKLINGGRAAGSAYYSPGDAAAGKRPGSLPTNLIWHIGRSGGPEPSVACL